MTEPVYEYVKGEGWVIGPSSDFQIFEHDGDTWKIEHRHPVQGEYYMWVESYHSTWCKDGKPIFNTFIESFKRYGTYRYAGIVFTSNDVVCTVTQV